MDPSMPITRWPSLALLAIPLLLGWAAPACWLQVYEGKEADPYELNGAHTELSCSDCHGAEFANPSPARSCDDCHDADAPEGHLAGGCQECHNEDAWDEPEWEHEDFPLKGGHAGVPCIDCHEDGDDEAPEECEDCHQDDIPPGHYDSGCDHCHSIWSW